MNYLLITIALLITATGAHATQLDEALCKERPEFCRGRSQPPPPPVKREAPSGPEWLLIEGDKKKDIQTYLVQVAQATSYRNCFPENGKIQLPSGSLISLYRMLGREDSTVELQKNSVRPLFRISFEYDKKYETFVTTNPARTQIENISLNIYTEQENNYFTGPLDNPQLVKTKPKIIVQSLSCDSL